MTRSLRLLADDLTGALDSAAAFASPTAFVPVVGRDGGRPDGPLAIDSGTRETNAAAAADTVRRIAPALFAAPAALRYKKIDSLLRGNEAAEIAAILEACAFGRCVIAPAFPAQGRITRAGRQMVLGADGTGEALPVDLAVRLEALGFPVTPCRPGDPAPRGLSLWDAASDRDLDAIAAAATADDDLLWVGSGGLAAALARRFAAPPPPQTPPPLRGPLLGLFGTDHAVMEAQLAVVPEHRFMAASDAEAEAIEARLRDGGPVLVSVAVPPGTPRDLAANRIETVLGSLVRRLPAPGTLLVAGGETLRRLCGALGADRLDVQGELLPGVPCSVLRGGRWDGTAVVSKSGAFGTPGFLDDLVARLPVLQGTRA